MQARAYCGTVCFRWVCVECMRTYMASPKVRATQRAYRATPRMKALAQLSYRNSPRMKASQLSYRASQKGKAIRNAREAKRRASDTNYRLAENLRLRFRDALRGNFKAGSAVRDLGCTIEYFKAYIAKKFVPGMSWENWASNTWHLDHIRPLASFDLSNREEFLKACHFSNYQPLWGAENCSKGSLYNGVRHRRPARIEANGGPKDREEVTHSA